jgi:hypothetical protein
MMDNVMPKLSSRNRDLINTAAMGTELYDHAILPLLNQGQGLEMKTIFKDMTPRLSTEMEVLLKIETFGTKRKGKGRRKHF